MKLNALGPLAAKGRRPIPLPNAAGRGFSLLALLLLATFALPALAHAVPLPTFKIGMEEATSPKQVSVLVEILLIFTVLSMAPAILLMMTCFTRLIVSFSFLRHALGTQQMPPNQILVGLALFLTFFIMTPVFTKMNDTAIKPYLAEQITAEQALTEGVKPLRAFMFKQTREKDLALFMSLAKMAKPNNKDEVPTTTLIPAFMISELKTAFEIGFILFLPFLIIDMVVASVLLSMGMMMLPPVMVSLPFKLLLFVLVDGWYLIVGSLVKSFGV
ncbi:MAG: flagellar type III secretion system pore protein FliP [Desulfobulbaceae bacterium]|nr:flagellar type III secretion system pore protein FliP [Desulfobulbaceae bacterium]